MFKLRHKIFLAGIFAVGVCVGFPALVGGGERIERPKEKIEGSKPTISKPDKWTRGQRIDSFKKVADREPPPRGGKPTPKVEKWSRGDLKKKFNDAANPPKKDGDKKGGENPPVPPPPIVPKWKPPGM